MFKPLSLLIVVTLFSTSCTNRRTRHIVRGNEQATTPTTLPAQPVLEICNGIMVDEAKEIEVIRGQFLKLQESVLSAQRNILNDQDNEIQGEVEGFTALVKKLDEKYTELDGTIQTFIETFGNAQDCRNNEEIISPKAVVIINEETKVLSSALSAAFDMKKNLTAEVDDQLNDRIAVIEATLANQEAVAVEANQDLENNNGTAVVESQPEVIPEVVSTETDVQPETQPEPTVTDEGLALDTSLDNLGTEVQLNQDQASAIEEQLTLTTNTAPEITTPVVEAPATEETYVASDAPEATVTAAPIVTEATPAVEATPVVETPEEEITYDAGELPEVTVTAERITNPVENEDLSNLLEQNKKAEQEAAAVAANEQFTALKNAAAETSPEKAKLMNGAEGSVPSLIRRAHDETFPRLRELHALINDENEAANKIANIAEFNKQMIILNNVAIEVAQKCADFKKTETNTRLTADVSLFGNNATVEEMRPDSVETEIKIIPQLSAETHFMNAENIAYNCEGEGWDRELDKENTSDEILFNPENPDYFSRNLSEMNDINIEVNKELADRFTDLLYVRNNLDADPNSVEAQEALNCAVEDMMAVLGNQSFVFLLQRSEGYKPVGIVVNKQYVDVIGNPASGSNNGIYEICDEPVASESSN